MNSVPESDLLWILDCKLNNRVTKLTIPPSGDDSFLEFLCKERRRDGVAKWPFPKLKTLEIPEKPGKAKIPGERLKRLLRQRYAPGIGTLEPLIPLLDEAPDRLASLFMPYTRFSGSDSNDIVNIVGAGVHGLVDYCLH